MKIAELWDKLEDIQNKLCVIYETTNAVGASLDQQILKADQVGFAISGITDNVGSVIKEVESLVEETMKMKKVIESL